MTTSAAKSSRLFCLLGIIAVLSPSLFAQTYNAQAQIDAITSQMNQYKVDIETQKLAQLKDRTRNDQRSAQTRDVTIKRLQNLLAIRQLELTMYQQQLSFEKQQRSANPAIAAVQVAIQQLTLEKARYAIKQTQFTQVGNTKDATYYGQLIATQQTKIQVKQQEMKLLLLQDKTGKK